MQANWCVVQPRLSALACFEQEQVVAAMLPGVTPKPAREVQA
jgi:hypothetical protein